MTAVQNFEVGAKVKSFDFPGISNCYVEGTVIKVDKSFQNYEVLVTRKVMDGKEITFREGSIVYPPLNGLSGFFGPTNGVIAL